MKISTFISQLLIARVFQLAHGQNLLDGFVSNVEEAVRPAQNTAGSFLGNVGNNIASAADQAGNFAASAASDAISAVNSYEGNQISGELASYHSATSRLYHDTLLLASTGFTMAICLCNYL